MRLIAVVTSFTLLSALLTPAIAANYSPLYAYSHKQAVADMERTQVPQQPKAIGENPENPNIISVMIPPASLCISSLCLGSLCLGASVCIWSACGMSVCFGSVCLGSLCFGSICIESVNCGPHTMCVGECDVRNVVDPPTIGYECF